MANLRDRLRRIKTHAAPAPASTPAGPARRAESALFPGWETAGFQLLRRRLFFPLRAPLPSPLLAVFVPETSPFSAPERQEPAADIRSYLFFDLETTGLSGGAGTVAFLAAFGSFTTGECLEVRQYLLLDYPGEGSFLEAVLAETAAGAPVVTFNGKTFDSQILKTRCLMNALPCPAYPHADLLHISRRLWKSVLPSCAQREIETRVLGLSREGDQGGEEAPESWFTYLKTGDNRRLLAACEHNVRDIQGLAALLGALAEVARFPEEAESRFQANPEALALLLYRSPLPQAAGAGQLLLKSAAERGLPRAGYIYARQLEKAGQYDLARRHYTRLAASCHPRVAALSCRRLSLDAAWRLHAPALALRWAKAACAQPASPRLHAALHRRLLRLQAAAASTLGLD